MSTCREIVTLFGNSGYLKSMSKVLATRTRTNIRGWVGYPATTGQDDSQEVAESLSVVFGPEDRR